MSGGFAQPTTQLIKECFKQEAMEPDAMDLISHCRVERLSSVDARGYSPPEISFR